MHNLPNGASVPAGIPAGPSGNLGGSWWSRQFKLSVLECFSPFAKGLPYVQDGQVTDLEINPGVVTARVQGSRTKPYKVEIQLPLLGAEQWEALEAGLADRLGPGAMAPGPLRLDDLGPLLAEASLALFPAGPHELAVSCTCAENPKPCRHVAGTYYRLGGAFDRDPLLLCRWRGRDPEELLERVARLRGTLPEAEPAPAHAASRCPGAVDGAAFYLEVREHCRMDVERINLDILAEWGRLQEEIQRVQGVIHDLEVRKLVAGQIYNSASELMGDGDRLEVCPANPEG
jgi:uncharacterized Zn finger protein